MMGKSHLTIGVTTGSWTAYALPLNTGMAVLVGIVGAAYALAPDLDHLDGKATHSFHDGRHLSRLVRSFGGHRTWTHDPRIGPPVFAAITAALVFCLHGPIGEHWWAYGIAAWVGCMAHLWADARTISGIPCGKRRITIGRTFRTNSDRETWLRAWIYRPVAVASVAATAWLALH